MGFVVRDSAGVAIAESVEPLWGEGDGWTVASEPEVVIGELEGEVPYLLDAVQGVRRLDDGRIAVLNGGSSEVRIYDGEGRHLVDLGGPGEGPAELARPQFMGLVGDTIVVYEYAPSTLTWFDPAGEHLRTTTLQAEGAPPYGIAFGLLGGDAVAVAAPVVRPDYSPGRTREVMSIWRLDTEGQEADSLTEIRTEEIVVHNTGGWNTMTFGNTTYWAASDDAIYLAPTEAYSIRVLDPEGSVRRIVRRRVEPRPVTPRDLRRYAEQAVEALFLPPERVDPLVARNEEIGIGDVMPAYRMIVPDAAGNLWVEELDDVGIRQGAFSVFGPDGAWLGRVDLPPGLPFLRSMGIRPPLLEIGEDYVLGVWVGELGVEQVRLYRLEKG